VLLSHDHHGDNRDAAGRALLPPAGDIVTTASGAKRLGVYARGLEPWATTRLEAPGRPAIEIIATPCRDGPRLSQPLAGVVVGFALRWDGQQHGVVWSSGDTVLYDGVREVADRLRIGTTLLISGACASRSQAPVRYSMTAREAVELCRLIEPRTVVPIYYEGWSHFREGREAVEAEPARARGRARAGPVAADRGRDRARRVSAGYPGLWQTASTLLPWGSRT